jgi:hypothetical protein
LANHESVIEGFGPVGKNLGCFVAFSGHKHDIARLCILKSGSNCKPAILNNPWPFSAGNISAANDSAAKLSAAKLSAAGSPASLEDLVQDCFGVFGAWII